MSDTEFESFIREKVDDFLQTVVIVDDEAYRVAQPSAPPIENSEEGGNQSGIPRPPRLQLRPPTTPPAADELDPRTTARVFAEHGLACAILSPQDTDENIAIVNPLLKAARRADLVVLDWMLNGDDGETTTNLFRQLLARDDAVERRLRVVAVYTGEPKLELIAERLKKIAGESIPGEKLVADMNLPQFTCGPVRVAVLAKEHVENLPDHLAAQRTLITDLPNRLCQEFCQLCTGLVSGATISALTGIREEAHRLLTAMSPALDPALLGHRVTLPQPEDAERHLEGLIAAEIAAIIADREVGSVANTERIGHWLANQPDLPVGGTLQHVTSDNLASFLTIGLSEGALHSVVMQKRADQKDWTKNQLRKIRADATCLFVASPAEAQNSDREFFERMLFRTRYAKPEPVLMLGTLVKCDDQFLMCVQPACDSVRLQEKTQFPFLRVHVVGEEARGPDILVVRDPAERTTWFTLEIGRKASALALETFTPAADGTVRSQLGETVGSQVFSSSDGMRRYRWIADLKPDQAQRVAENLGSVLSRVGLNDPEMLRQKRN